MENVLVRNCIFLEKTGEMRMRFGDTRMGAYGMRPYAYGCVHTRMEILSVKLVLLIRVWDG